MVYSLSSCRWRQQVSLLAPNASLIVKMKMKMMLVEETVWLKGSRERHQLKVTSEHTHTGIFYNECAFLLCQIFHIQTTDATSSGDEELFMFSWPASAFFSAVVCSAAVLSASGRLPTIALATHHKMMSPSKYQTNCSIFAMSLITLFQWAWPRANFFWIEIMLFTYSFNPQKTLWEMSKAVLDAGDISR